MVWWILVILVTAETLHHGAVEAPRQRDSGSPTRAESQDRSQNGTTKLSGPNGGVQPIPGSSSLWSVGDTPQCELITRTSQSSHREHDELMEVHALSEVEQSKCGILSALWKALGTGSRKLLQHHDPRHPGLPVQSKHHGRRRPGHGRLRDLPDAPRPAGEARARARPTTQPRQKLRANMWANQAARARDLQPRRQSRRSKRCRLPPQLHQCPRRRLPATLRGHLRWRNCSWRHW